MPHACRYDVELYQRIEHLIGKKLPAYETVEEEVMVIVERVSEAQRHARHEMKEIDEKKRSGKRKNGDQEGANDAEGSLGVQHKIRKKIKGNSDKNSRGKGRGQRR